MLPQKTEQLILIILMITSKNRYTNIQPQSQALRKTLKTKPFSPQLVEIKRLSFGSSLVRVVKMTLNLSLRLEGLSLLKLEGAPLTKAISPQ